MANLFNKCAKLGSIDPISDSEDMANGAEEPNPSQPHAGGASPGVVGGPRIPCAGNSTSKLPNSCAAHTPVDQSIKARHASEASPLGPHTTSEASPLGPHTRFRFNILPYTRSAEKSISDRIERKVTLTTEADRSATLSPSQTEVGARHGRADRFGAESQFQRES